MENKYKIGILFLLVILSGCSKISLEENWYLVGGDIRFYIDLKKKKILRFSEKEKLILEASIQDYKFTEKNKLKVHALVREIGEKREYQLKYGGIQDFILWLEIQKGQMKLIFNKFYEKPYYFSTQSRSGSQVPYRFISSYEVEDFKGSSNFKDIKRDNNLEILINKLPAMTREEVIKNEKSEARKWFREKYQVGNQVIRAMQDYLIDLDFSTYWATRPGDFWNTEMEIFIKDSSGKKLHKPVYIRALYFNTGNLDQKSRYYQYHRAKDVVVSFSRDYEGSLGSSKANYNEVKYYFELPDSIEEKIIVFLKPVPANSIRLEFEDFYMGYENAFALYDFTIFIDSD